MPAATETIAERALSLPSDDRLALVDRLLQSLNLPIADDIDEAWAAEAERRVRELDEGTVTAVPGGMRAQ
jgi:putative addiction module component (TIGR02574 family)